MSASTSGPVRIAVLPGDAIGPEISAATLAVLREVDGLFHLNLAFEEHAIGFASLASQGTTLPESAIEAARKADGVILGPNSPSEYPPVSEGGHNVSRGMRMALDLYANIRPARSRPGIPLPCGKPLDLVVVRENTEGFYADRSMFMGPGEMMPTPDVAIAFRKITRHASMRIAEAAFALAMRRRKKLTAVVKKNVLRLTDGLFRECVHAVGAKYPQVEYDEKAVDAMAALLIRNPTVYDVVLTTNMFGDILSDEASELSGSLGLGASLNLGDGVAVAQAQHGSAPDIAGKDLANPTSLVSSAAMLLGWLGERRGDERFARAQETIERALDAVLARPETRTRDLGGSLGTKAFTERLVGELSKSAVPAT